MLKANLPLLTKHSLHALLLERFEGNFAKLSDIPNPSQLADADKAAERIAEAVKRNERIVLVGDYDVDGVTSTALTTLFFREIPYPLEVIIPNRFTDGYGVSPKILERIEADLVITVDNGINAHDAADICKARGIDLIITDHHTPSDTLPDAYAIVDPKLAHCPYPFKEICGAQVAWLVMGLVKQKLELAVDMKQFLDLLALAVIADVMPLTDINRAIVQSGLKLMMRSKRPSSIIIREFLEKSSISAEDIAFQIAPRLNSAGRLEDASIALEFLIAEDEQSAYHQFDLLDQLNTLRKATEAQTTEQALAAVNPEDKVIVVAGDRWHEGVVGIVAARLVQQYGKPAIVLSIEGDRAKGSARSVGNVNIYELIKEQEAYLDKYGGHMMAAGLSLHPDKINAFRQAINTAAQKIPEEDFVPKEDVLGILDPQSIDFELLHILEQFEPFGEANPRPRFLAKDAQVVNIKYFGAENNHSRIKLKFHPMQRHTHELVAFRQNVTVPENGKMTCSYTVTKNEYNGRVSLQMMVERIYP